MMVACTVAIIVAVVMTGLMIRSGLDRIAEAIENERDEQDTEPDPGVKLQQRLHEVQAARFGPPILRGHGSTETI